MKIIQSERASAHILHTLLAVFIGMLAVVTWDAVKNDPRFPLAGWFSEPAVEPPTVPNPYTFTRVLIEEWRADSLRFHATFEKHACDLLAFKAFGVFGDVTEQLKIKDEDGYSDDENRIFGLHTLRLIVDVDPDLWDVVEFRTRHLCFASDGTARNVDKVFYVSRRP